jgi:hypothetical protein
MFECRLPGLLLRQLWWSGYEFWKAIVEAALESMRGAPERDERVNWDVELSHPDSRTGGLHPRRRFSASGSPGAPRGRVDSGCHKRNRAQTRHASLADLSVTDINYEAAEHSLGSLGSGQIETELHDLGWSGDVSEQDVEITNSRFAVLLDLERHGQKAPDVALHWATELTKRQDAETAEVCLHVADAASKLLIASGAKEPTLADVLSGVVSGQMMRADRVERRDVEKLMKNAKSRRRAKRRSRPDHAA